MLNGCMGFVRLSTEKPVQARISAIKIPVLPVLLVMGRSKTWRLRKCFLSTAHKSFPATKRFFGYSQLVLFAGLSPITTSRRIVTLANKDVIVLAGRLHID
jgi:hypothetical protein